jgi:hypothetical protein
MSYGGGSSGDSGTTREYGGGRSSETRISADQVRSKLRFTCQGGKIKNILSNFSCSSSSSSLFFCSHCSSFSLIVCCLCSLSSL